jgi:hypothetical protein
MEQLAGAATPCDFRLLAPGISDPAGGDGSETALCPFCAARRSDYRAELREQTVIIRPGDKKISGNPHTRKGKRTGMRVENYSDGASASSIAGLSS